MAKSDQPPKDGIRQQRADDLRREVEQQRAQQAAAQESATSQEPDTPAETAAPAQAEAPSEEAKPVGKGKHEVRKGECISSIAFEAGHFWETVWDHPDNAELKRERGNPNVLLPGDRVTIPELRPKDEPGETEQRHRFRRRGAPEELDIIVKVDDEPMANEPYILDIDGDWVTGTTDAQGRIHRFIRPDAVRGTLRVGSGVEIQEFQVKLGTLNPITALSGVKRRLENLGYHCGPDGEELDEVTVEAIKAFQEKVGLPVTGRPDQATRDAIVQDHGS